MSGGPPPVELVRLPLYQFDFLQFLKSNECPP